MTVFELHLALDQRYQEMASYKREKFRPEEKDLVLNKAMFRLLERGVRTKFQDSEINLSHVTALLHKNRIAEVIQPLTTDSLYESASASVYAVKPADFYWLVNGRAEILTDPLNCTTAPIINSTAITEYVAVVPFPTPSAAPYYSSTTIISSVLGTLYTAPSVITAGFGSTNSKYVVVNNIVEQSYRRLVNPTVQIYWERYRDVYYQNSFIVVNPTNLGTVILTSGGVSSTIVSTPTTYYLPNRAAISALTSKQVSLVPTKTTEEDLLYQALSQNSFYKTSTDEVVTAQTEDYFIIYQNESFIVTRYHYDYIRKPRTISLALNQSCELASTTHERIIDLAVELLRVDTKQENYPATVQDSNLRT